jgi:hypothetical protein
MLDVDHLINVKHFSRSLASSALFAASFLGYQKAKDLRFSQDKPASLRNFPSHSGHFLVLCRKSGRNGSENAVLLGEIE